MSWSFVTANWSFIIAGLSALAGSAIMLSLTTNVLSNAIWHVMLKIAPRAITNKERFGIRGFWLGRVDDREEPGKVSYNLWKIVGGIGEVSHHGEHYNSTISQVLRGHGKGTFDPPYFSAYYRFSGGRMNRNGVVVFNLTTITGHEPVLAGFFEQFADHTGLFWKKFHKETKREKYVLVRVDLPTIPYRLRRVFGRSHFKDIGELRAFIECLPDAKKSLLLARRVAIPRSAAKAAALSAGG